MALAQIDLASIISHRDELVHPHIVLTSTSSANPSSLMAILHCCSRLMLGKCRVPSGGITFGQLPKQKWLGFPEGKSVLRSGSQRWARWEGETDYDERLRQMGWVEWGRSFLLCYRSTYIIFLLLSLGSKSLKYLLPGKALIYRTQQEFW